MKECYCTGEVMATEFPEYLKNELGEPRRNIKLFTAELNDVFGTEYLTPVNSGSSANLVAAMMVKEQAPRNRKDIVVAGFTFPTTVSAYTMLGYNVRVIDVTEGDFNMSPEVLKNAIDIDTAAVVVTHFLGFPAAIDEIASICSEHGALLVQDACETMDLKYNDVPIHSFGDIITHSFYHPHHMSSYGGGAIICNNEEMFRLAESITHWGRSCMCHIDEGMCENFSNGISPVAHNFTYVRPGVNVEISELNACFGRLQLGKYRDDEILRKERYQLLYDKLSGINGVTTWLPEFNTSAFVFPIQVDANKRDAIMNAIIEKGLYIRTLMGGGIHGQSAFNLWIHEGVKNTVHMSDTTFFCGIHQTLSIEDFNHSIEILAEVLNEYANVD